LGSASAPGNGAAVPEWAPELIRIDGDRSISHTLSRRTRIGRAAGCELHIDSTSVSRHHALILAGTREAIIEDLNSTNGVIVNGRKVTRQVLNDGDILTLGEIQFRYVAKPIGVPPKG
jgi:pSer/pThr/pTyr-binding forkhead associated (FHA) protein